MRYETFKNLRAWKGTNCSAELKMFREDSSHPRVAISSFPGSGNTWARHLLHMGSGFWTGNRRSSKTLKGSCPWMQNLYDNFSKMQRGQSIILAAGWLAEDLDCRDRRTIAQKTHRLSNNKGRIKKITEGSFCFYRKASLIDNLTSNYFYDIRNYAIRGNRTLSTL